MHIKTLPILSNTQKSTTETVSVVDGSNQIREVRLPCESPLTLKVDGVELVTLMTLGNFPELLALGYLRNQRLAKSIFDIKSITVDWDREHALITTHTGQGILNPQVELGRKIITSGCGQGTVFSCSLNELYELKIEPKMIKQSEVYALLNNLEDYNQVYKNAGGVHGCALCNEGVIEIFVEDVGRHNATDIISGKMWLDDLNGANKVFYTTGRLTSEMVIKSAFMGIPVLISRSGVTMMGLELARNLGLTVIARAKGRHFLVYHQSKWVEFDALNETKRPIRA